MSQPQPNDRRERFREPEAEPVKQAAAKPAKKKTTRKKK